MSSFMLVLLMSSLCVDVSENRPFPEASSRIIGSVPTNCTTKLCTQIHKECVAFCRTLNGIRYRYCLRDCQVERGIGHCDSPYLTPDTENINDEKSETGETLWEGDMLLTSDQVNLLFGKGRKAEKRLEYRWPNGLVPYSIKDDSRANTPLIMKAINHWMENTCIQFVEVAEKSKFPHIIFQSGRGCHSRVGMQLKRNPHGQAITIGKGCEHVGKIAHELGHVIGFYHEHSRPDRDKYVKIMMENVAEKHMKNFVYAKNINPHNITYDLDSLMHYHAKEFTKNGKDTIIPLNPLKQYDIGQRKGLSFLDIKMANVMYNCSEHCDDHVTCYNDGFLDKNCQCQCAPNYGGKYCENYTPPPAPLCGGIRIKPGIIKTPNFPSKYPALSNCVWWIKAPSSYRVVLHFNEFQVDDRHPSAFICKNSAVEIRASDTYTGDTYCGNEQRGKTITSRFNQMIILFHSKKGRQKGFEATFRFI